jgi:hypothetical protein
MYFATVVCPTSIPSESFYTLREAQITYETYPPPEIASDLADFQSRHGDAPRFAGKGREIALGRCRMGRYEGRSAGRLRASSQGGGRAKPTPPTKR